MHFRTRRCHLRAIAGAVVVATLALATIGPAFSQTASEVPPGEAVEDGALTASPEVTAVPTAGAVQGAGKSKSSMRDVFAGTLAVVLQASGSTLAVGLAQALTGGLTEWFSRKLNAKSGPPADASAEPGSFAASAAEMQITESAGTQSPGGPLVAGLAFEVHAMGGDGTTVPVDPVAHQFRTGDRFVVYFRPALPGFMDVYNINAAGIQTHIDSQELAAAQLARLGPYEFAAMTGEEQLRLVLSPCSTPALAGATRDIVKVPTAVPTGPGIGIAACSSPLTRSIRDVPTRDIRKVAVEGTTGFALDPLTSQEMASGQVQAREVTIRLQHR